MGNTLLFIKYTQPMVNLAEVIMSDELELELNTTQVEHEYGGSEIQVLEGLEGVRKGPGL